MFIEPSLLVIGVPLGARYPQRCFAPIRSEKNHDCEAINISHLRREPNDYVTALCTQRTGITFAALPFTIYDSLFTNCK